MQIRKSFILHCERSELRLHFEWKKTNQKCQNWSILKKCDFLSDFQTLCNSIGIAILSTLLRISAMVLVTIFFQTQSNSSKVKIFFIVVMTLMCIYILVDFLLLWGIYKRQKGLLYLWIGMAIIWLALMVLKIFLDFVPPGKQKQD